MEDCWDDQNIEIMKEEDEYFKLLKILFLEFHLNKYSVLCSCIVLVYHIPLWAAQFYYFYKSNDLYFVLEYAPCSVVFLYGIASMAIPIVYNRTVIDIKEGLYKMRWSLKHASIKFQEETLQKAKLFQIVAIVNITLALITYIFALLRAAKGNPWEIFFQVTFLKQHFPEHSTILIIIFYATLIYFILPMLTIAYLFAYYTWELYVQALLITERITNITRNFPNDVELFSVDTYQNQVFQRLRFCMKRWIELKKFTVDHLDIIPDVVIMYSLMSILVIICYLATWYFDQNKYYPLFISITITSSFTGLVVAETGQIIEDVSNEMYTALVSLPWYTFNKKNMKIYLMCLTYSITPICVSPLEALPVNRRIIVHFYKVFSSFSALLANSSEKLKWSFNSQ